MNDQTIEEMVEELRPLLSGRAWGKVFQLSRASLAVDFRTGDGRYLFIAAEPGDPRLYLTARTVRELEKASLSPSTFLLTLRKHLGGAILRDLSKDEGDRVVRFSFAARDVVGHERERTLIAQLTGRAANLFLLDEAGRVADALRTPHGAGQEIGEQYAPPASPPRAAAAAAPTAPAPARGSFATLSEAVDARDRRLERERIFDARSGAHLARASKAIDKRRKLLRNLERDLSAHGDAEEHRRLGDLLLANVATAERAGARVRLTDYYAEGTPTVELEIDEHRSLQEEAALAFARYTKAKRAAQEIAQRLEATRRELAVLEAERAAIESIIKTRDDAALEAFESGMRAGVGGAKRRAALRGGAAAPGTADSGHGSARDPRASKRQKTEALPGVRRYLSSDGYEILVGRGARDNDHLTSRIARPHDLWLHAADYPGSHVVVRNHARERDVPHRTIIEAAQLAAHFSQASKDAKVAVNYTPRKFVSKPKGAAHGLVRLSSFRTLLVEPGERVERL
jgi:predicted ribosome quality control (RQC) complex YloA/Tae2 family protein